MRKRDSAGAAVGVAAIVVCGLAIAQLFGLTWNVQRDELRYDKRAPIAYWQTYSQSPADGIHEYVEGEYPFEVERLPSPAKTFRTGYAFIADGEIHFEDRGNYIQYRPTQLGYREVDRPAGDRYEYRGREFTFNYKTGVLSACPLSGTAECRVVNVKVGTFPYVYASKGGSVIAVTNYGDALLFRDDEWCRMSMSEDVYSCRPTEPKPIDKPREIQFYSSILYQGSVLLGEWPTGRLYEFDGNTLQPSGMTPPAISAVADKRLGYEAQSMAEYCGDLFVGYWPKGEVWRYDHREKEWRFFKRFFTEEPEEYFIPHKDRTADHLDSAFFGQRITALVPFEDSLYVSTSNLRSWKSGEVVPETVGPEKAKEYGAIYKITRHGCRSTYGKEAP